MRLVLEGDTVKFEPDFKDFEVSNYVVIYRILWALLAGILSRHEFCMCALIVMKSFECFDGQNIK